MQTTIRACAHTIRRSGWLLAALCMSTAAPAQTSSLSGSVDSSTTSVNLTTQGTTDWAHWGSGGGLISTSTVESGVRQGSVGAVAAIREGMTKRTSHWGIFECHRSDCTKP